MEPVFEDVPVQPSAPAFHEESSPTAPSFIFNSTLDRQNLPQINEINLPVNLDEPQSSQSITNIFPGVTENTGATSAAEVANQYSENEEIQCDTKEEEEIIEMLKASPSSSTSPYKSNDTTKTTKVSYIHRSAACYPSFSNGDNKKSYEKGLIIYKNNHLFRNTQNLTSHFYLATFLKIPRVPQG